jgi:hypothetical protein
MYNKYMGNTPNKSKINIITNINTNPSLKNDMRAYYSSILNKLQYVINHSKNKKIISIIPKQNDLYTHGYENNCNSEYKGIIIKYDDGELLNLSCDSIESDVIMWYYDINNKTNTTYINDDFKKYIKKNIQKS